MDILSPAVRAQLNTLLSKVSQWRHSLFWTIVPAMFVVTCGAGAAVNIFATVEEDHRLQRVLEPAALERALAPALRRSGPPSAWTGLSAQRCSDALHVLAERALMAAMHDRTGDGNPNGFHQALASGRLALSLRGSGGMRCELVSDNVGVLPALRRHMDASSARGAGTGRLAKEEGSWVSVTTVAPQGPDGLVLTVGVQILSPFTKLFRPRAIIFPLAMFFLGINALTALVLVLLLLGRIQRADATATAWTLGDFGKRIGDSGRDEFSRLTHKFDVMADAMSGVIAVKQSLAAAEERNRLARDLHDSAKQRAFALNLQLSAAQNWVLPGSDGKRLLDAALTLTAQLQQDLRSVIQRLTATTIVESGFRRVLAEALESMLAGSGIGWTLLLEERDEAALMAKPEVSHQLLLITMEAVANALKHAACTHCTITGERVGERYTWRIADNGTAGFPVETKGKGMGLANMKLRAHGLDEGAFAVLPEAGGTVVTVSFHLPEQT